MKFVVGENGRNPEKNLPRPRFVHHETHMEEPRRELGTPSVGGERLTACATTVEQLRLLTILLQTKNTVFLFEYFNYSVFYVSSLCLNDAHLRTRRHRSSVLGKCRSVPPSIFCLVHTFPRFPYYDICSRIVKITAEKEHGVLFQSFTYSIFFVSSLRPNEAHLRTRRRQSSVLGK